MYPWWQVRDPKSRVTFQPQFREQYDREEAISEFKAGIAMVLIATDVASRGLDINNVT